MRDQWADFGSIDLLFWQVDFYGFLPWIIMQRLTLPLCIFYRFHSAVTYAEIWKNTYRFAGSSSDVEAS